MDSDIMTRDEIRRLENFPMPAATDEILTKAFPFEVKAANDAGTFEGYASAFGAPPDAQGDIIKSGAFSETLAKHHREGTMPLMLFGHKANELPIGNWDDMAEDGKGLWVKGSLDLEDPFAVRVYGKLKRKSFRGLSIGFSVAPGGSEPDEKRPGVTTLTELVLWEVSLVNFASNRRAIVNQVKGTDLEPIYEKLSAGGRLSERECEQVFKAPPFNLSNSQAERAVRVNLKRGQGDPDVTAELVAKQAHSALREALAAFKSP